MDKEIFNKTLSNSGTQQEFNIRELETLVDHYPYLQSARALLLKAYKQKESYKYNHFLKSTAAFTTDRSILFEYITSKHFKQEDISKSIKQNLNHLKLIELVDEEQVRDNILQDEKVEQFIKATDGVLNPDLFEIKSTEKRETKLEVESEVDDNENNIDIDNHHNLNSKKEETEHHPVVENFFESIKLEPNEITEIESEEGNKEKSIDFSSLQLGKPLEFNINEEHSFSEWLKITALKPIQRIEVTLEDNTEHISNTTESDKSTNEPDDTSGKESFHKKLAIIDKFLESNPKIKPPTEKAPQPKLVDNSDTLEDSLMTETLARIYLEQKNYDKAIQAYKILSLKYPEKSSFFAHQILLVNILKEKNNT